MDERSPSPRTLTAPGPLDAVPRSPGPAEGQLLAGRYEVRGLIGTGGTASVHEAYDRELHRTVALKVLRSLRTGPGGVARLRREVAAAHDAESPHLVRVFDLGQAGDVAFLTMERVDGTSLREQLEQGPLPEAEAVRVAADVLRALAALHAVGIVHRDVKPGNILLAADGTVKLADFGLVVRTDSSDTRLTATEGLVGTPGYISPEQALGRELDGRSDLYSLGLVLFEMLAGSVPFLKETPIASALARLHAPAPDLAAVRRGTPAWLASIVARLLERDPARRYPSASAVLSDLSAHRATRAPRGRGRAARLVLAGFVLAAVAAAGWQLRQSRFHRLVASDAHERPGIRALDRAGRLLWERPDMVPGINAALAHVAGAGDVVAAILGGTASPAAIPPGDPRRSLLSFLDRQNGTLLSSTRLPGPGTAFPGFTRTFEVARLAAVDVDGDGLDELVVVLAHNPYWPSYTVVHEPRSRSSRVVFLGSGHHRFQAAVDLDGDGRKELVLAGPNNRMGMMTGIAAVRVPPRPFAGGQEEAPTPSVAVSPDASRSSPALDALAWYTLVERRSSPAEELMTSWLTWDGTRRHFTVLCGSLSPAHLDARGLRSGAPSPLSPDERVRARDAAFASLRASAHFQESGLALEALRTADEAVAAARRAAEPGIELWSRRVRAQAFARAGRRAEAERAFEELLSSPATPTEIAHDAGVAFHLAGDPASAARWFTRGIERTTELARGRQASELAMGALLALAELGRTAEAAALVERFGRTFPEDSLSRLALADAASVVGVEPGAGCRPAETVGADELQQYWNLECQLRQGAAPATLLESVRGEERRASETKPLLLALEAELLSRTGRTADASRAADDSWVGLRAGRSASTPLRAYASLAGERAARVAAAAGRPADARAVRAELRRWRDEVARGSGPGPATTPR